MSRDVLREVVAADRGRAMAEQQLGGVRDLVVVEVLGVYAVALEGV